MGRRITLDGIIHPDFIDVAKTLENQIEQYRGGAAVAIYQSGECVVDLWGGERDEAGNPWRRETMSPSFSTTKGVASTLLHIMVDRGLVDYDCKVAKYWPEFGKAGKQDITVRQVLAHQSGLYHIRQMIDDASRMLDWEHMVEAIERAEPVHTPGDRTGYHGLTFGFLVGEILQRVTNESFPRLVRREIAEPLGLEGFYVGAPDEVIPDAAQLMWPKSADLLRDFPDLPDWVSSMTLNASSLLTQGLGYLGVDLDLVSIMDALAPRGISGFDFGSPECLSAAIPAGNGLFTARDLARMYAALAGGGEIDGVRLLSRRAVQRATEVQCNTNSLSVLPFDMRWRLGYHGVVTSRGVPREAFGHFGFGGSGAWADPRRELAVAMVVNCGMGTPFGDLRIVRMGGAALAAAQMRRGETPSMIDRSARACAMSARSFFSRTTSSLSSTAPS